MLLEILLLWSDDFCLFNTIRLGFIFDIKKLELNLQRKYY